MTNATAASRLFWNATALAAGILIWFAPLATLAQPTIDGDLSDPEYTWIANDFKSNGEPAEGGFGTTNDVDSLGFYVGDNNLFVATAGTLEVSVFGANDFGIFLNITGSNAPVGETAGNTLGFAGNDLLFINGAGDGSGDNQDFAADFEVDFATAIGPKGPDSARAAVADYTGGSPAGIPFGNFPYGAVQSSSGIEVTYVNPSGDVAEGAEWRLSFNALGADEPSQQNFEVSAFVVSRTGFFSNEIIPGDGTTIGDNAGNDANWQAIADSTGETWHTGETALPVELTSFEAELSGQDALLNWTTASETNNSGFEVQHAVGDEAFEQVGWVDGAGTTNEAQNYQFRLNDLSAGTHQFRLRQVDLDGTSERSDPTTVTVRPGGPVAIENVSPHPVTESGTMSFTTRESGEVTVELYDMLGRRVTTLHQGRVSANQPQQVSFDAASLSSGTYFLRLDGESFTETERVTVVR